MLLRGLDTLRQVAQITLDCTCTISRPAPVAETVNDATGRLAATPGTIVYAGTCGVFVPAERVAQQGDEPVEVYDAEVHLPWNAPVAKEGDAVHIDTVGANSDPALLNKSYTIASLVSTSIHVVRKLNCFTLAPTGRHL